MTTAAPPPAPPSISATALASLMADAAAGATPELLDVREAHELAAGMIAGAKHIPLGQVEARAGTLSRDQWRVVYCQHGVRSARAIAALEALGHRRLTNLAGGFAAWAALREPRDGPP